MIVEVNIDDTVKELSLTRDQVNEFKSLLITKLSGALYREWTSWATLHLDTTRIAYLAGLKYYKESDYVGGVQLTGTLPMMIEAGASAFDIKEGLLKSQKAKTSASGSKYITIPFQHATPGTLVNEALKKKDKPHMTKELYAKAQKLELDTKYSLGAKDRLKKKDLPKELQHTGWRAAHGKWGEYEHKNPIFEGLTRTGKGTHGQFGTFRRVSDNPQTGSDINSWIHPGLVARHFREDALEDMEVDLVVMKARDEFLERYFSI